MIILGALLLHETRSRLKERLGVCRKALVGLVRLVLMPLQLMFFFMSLNYILAITHQIYLCKFKKPQDSPKTSPSSGPTSRSTRTLSGLSTATFSTHTPNNISTKILIRWLRSRPSTLQWTNGSWPKLSSAPLAVSYLSFGP